MQAWNDPLVESAIGAYFRHVSERNKNAWFALFDKNAVVHEPVGTTPGEGVEGLEEVWQVFTGPFATFTIRGDEIFYAGTGAAVRWSAIVTSGDGHSVDIAGITVFEVGPEGRIQTAMSYWDPAAVLIQLAGGIEDDITELLQ
jgi:ketosteroid isomerase-like protein